MRFPKVRHIGSPSEPTAVPMRIPVVVCPSKSPLGPERKAYMAGPSRPTVGPMSRAYEHCPKRPPSVPRDQHRWAALVGNAWACPLGPDCQNQCDPRRLLKFDPRWTPLSEQFVLIEVRVHVHAWVGVDVCVCACACPCVIVFAHTRAWARFCACKRAFCSTLHPIN